MVKITRSLQPGSVQCPEASAVAGGCGCLSRSRFRTRNSLWFGVVLTRDSSYSTFIVEEGRWGFLASWKFKKLQNGVGIFCHHQLSFLHFPNVNVHRKWSVSKHVVCVVSWKKQSTDGSWGIPLEAKHILLVSCPTSWEKSPLFLFFWVENDLF